MRKVFGRRTLVLLLAGFVLGVLIGAFSPAVPATSTGAIHPAIAPAPPVDATPLVSLTAPAAVPVPSAQAIPGLTLSISDNPRAVCAYGGTDCAVGNGVSRVTMTAEASPNGIEAWPAVQVAFVVETTAYDGVYDPSAGDPGFDVCAQGGGAVCDESNGVPFFVAHAQQIAGAIQAANPHSQVSFAMVDYFATLDNFDDGDGLEYHVDIPTFVPASDFGSAVAGSFQANVLDGGYIYSDSDLSDNILHSSVITALYGTIIGSGLDWSPNTHHVIVWMGSTVPRDPSFTINYYPSSSDYSAYCQNCISSGCEPSYSFGAVQSPECEGWVRSNNGNVSDSIAGLARTAPECTDSIGKVCTVDVIDLYNGVTNPYSKQWVAGRTNGGPNSVLSWKDSTDILLAGCAMAAATGGTWNGPNYFSCPDGQTGQLQEVPFGSPYTPNTNNPTLLAAFRGIGFGPIETTLVANGTHQPMFQFAPYGAVQIAPASLGGPNFTSSCSLGNGVIWAGPTHCVAEPIQANYTGFSGSGASGVYSTYGWNWSSNASTNQMYIGDIWSVSFNVIVNGPPFATVPVDACFGYSCAVAGSQPVGGLYTWAAYLPITNVTSVVESFPVAVLTVEVTPVGPPPVALPPPPPIVPPPIPIAIPPALPIISPIGIAAQVGVANVALQAATAGFLGAGFIRVTQRNRPISMAVAAMSGKNKNVVSMFEAGRQQSSGSGIGRFE